MATIEDIQFHYDVHNDFYGLFLDKKYRAYSCGVWDGVETLEQAQENKIKRICSFARVEPGHRILDIGCGWGGLMLHAVNEIGAHCALGLTLSADQNQYIEQLADNRISAHLKSWAEPLGDVGLFDAITSVGAFEHFASREDRLDGRQRQIYKNFFRACRKLSTATAHLGLQTIVTAREPKTLTEARDARYLLDKVFPGSALPSVSDIQASAADIYEFTKVKRIGQDYARTLRCWRNRLEETREVAANSFGSDTVIHYLRYFEAAERSFAQGVTDLIQISLAPASGVLSDA